MVVNIHGDEISELFNFTPFCQLMRQHPQHSTRCRMSDRCGGLEASKSDQPCIYRCHAGLTDFSIPLVIAGHLVGFVLCGQVRLSNDVELVNILNVDDRWQADPELLNEFRNVPEMDYSRVIASADLLKLIVENCLKNSSISWLSKTIRSNRRQIKPLVVPTPHDSKMKKRFAILMRICPTIFVLRMSPHMSISAPITSVNYSKISGESDLMRG